MNTKYDAGASFESKPGANAGKGVLVHEWLAPHGGSENVFDAMVGAFPEADLLCLWNDKADRYKGKTVTETWIGRTPLRRSKVLSVPLMLPTWRFQPGDYEWALISSHLFAHHLRFPNATSETKKYVYVHSPARYIWHPELDARGKNPAVRALSAALKPLDRRRALEHTAIAANSKYVQERIQRDWHRDSTVIYPPVDVDRIQETKDWESLLDPSEANAFSMLPTEFLLGASRLIPYKALDLVIEAGRVSGLPVVIAGDGPERARLVECAERAGVRAYFVGAISDAFLFTLYQKCVAYVFPAIEDFGIMPVEAMAAGAKVLTGQVGGATETVRHGISGAHVVFEDHRSIRTGLDIAINLDPEDARQDAQRFSRLTFEKAITAFVTGG